MRAGGKSARAIYDGYGKALSTEVTSVIDRIGTDDVHVIPVEHWHTFPPAN